MPPFHGVIFDLDGTLLDSMAVWKQIDLDFLAARHLPVPEDYMRMVSAMSAESAAYYTIHRFNLKERPEDLMAEWFHLAKEAYQRKVPLKRGARLFLSRLRERGIPFAVATAGDPQLYQLTLRREKIFSWFHSFTTLQETSGNKGDPDIYLLAAKKLGVAPDRCIVFEDLYAGLSAASRCGFFTVAVADDWAAEEQPQLRAAADLYITDFEDPKLSDLLKQCE